MLLSSRPRPLRAVVTTVALLLLCDSLCLGAAAQAILSIPTVEQDVTEQQLNQGTAFAGGDGGLTISVTGAVFNVPLASTDKAAIITSMVSDSSQKDGFAAHKSSLLQVSSISNTASTIIITFRAQSDFDIDFNENINITVPDTALTTGVGIMTQAEPVQIRVATGTIVIAKRPYENPQGVATGHVMTENDARTDRPSFWVAVSPWENWKQIDGAPAGINNMATNCTASNRISLPYGWDARVNLGMLVEWHTARFTDSLGEYLKLTTVAGLEQWRYLEVFITPDPDYDTSLIETITVNDICAAPYLGSGLNPNPNVKLSFDINPTSGTYYIETNRGDSIWETDISVGAHCDWQGVTSVQFGYPDPYCNYDTSVSNPSQASTYSPFIITVKLEKGETWLQTATAQAAMISAFESGAGSDFVGHLDEMFKDTTGTNIDVTYTDDWTAVLNVRTWPQWALAKRNNFEVLDVTIEEYIELKLSHASVASNDITIAPQKSTAGSTKKPGFTVKPAPGWLIAEGNTQQCGTSTQAVCSGGCSWNYDQRCVTTDSEKRDMIFTETELRTGTVRLSLMFGSPPGYLPDTKEAVGSALYRPYHGSTTETWCTAVLATASVTSTANRCAKVIDNTDVQLAMVSDLTTLLTNTAGGNEPLPTYWNGREADLLTAAAVSVLPREIAINIPADPEFDIFTDEVVQIYIPGWSGTVNAPVTPYVMTSSGIVPVGQPLNLTIRPDHGVLTVTHATKSHTAAFIEFTEEEIRQGAGVLTLTWEGEMWKAGCCGQQAGVGLGLKSERTMLANPMGWNARVWNDTELLPDWKVEVKDMPAGVTMYGRTLELTLLPDALYDTSTDEHITISIFPDGVMSALSYFGFGYPQAACDPVTSSAACSDFSINIKAVGGQVMCVGGVNDFVCPDITEEDVRTGGKIMILRLDVGETWNTLDYPSPFQSTLIGLMNSVVTTSSEPLGFQARKNNIVLPAGVVADMSNSSRELIITLTADPNYDLVNNAREQVRIELFPRAVSSGLITTPQVLSFYITRAPTTMALSGCLGVQPNRLVGNPAPTTSPPLPALADCATGRPSVAQIHRVPHPTTANERVTSLVITEQDIREGDVSLRLTLQCGETWQTATQVQAATGKSREELIKEALAGVPLLDSMLSTAGLSTQIVIPSLATCPQTLAILLKKTPLLDVSAVTTVEMKLDSALFVSGEDYPPVYFTIIPFTGTVLLNIKTNSVFDSVNNVYTTGATVDNGVNSPLAQYTLDENVIRGGGFRLNMTFEVGETWRNTEECRLALLGNFEGLVNPNQAPSYSYKDTDAWGPATDNVHNTALNLPTGSGAVEFHPNGETRTVIINFAAVSFYDISVAQNISIEVSDVCTESYLKPWWEDGVRETKPEYTVTVTESPDVGTKVAEGDIYTQSFRNGTYLMLHDSGYPGVGIITITPAPGYIRLEMLDGRGCSGTCDAASAVGGDIEITDLEIRNGLGTNRLRLTMVGETWAVDSDTQAGTTCATATTNQWCQTAPDQREDVCIPTAPATTCQCTTAPFSTCCNTNSRCDGSGASPTLSAFNFKTLMWYYTYILGEDFPTTPVTGGGTFTGTVGSAIIASPNNPTTGFSARKSTVFPAPTLAGTTTSVTYISANVVEITLSQDTTFRLDYDEPAFISVPGFMTRSGMPPIPNNLNFSFIVTPIQVALGPKNTFTEREIRQGVTLTLTITTPGCWAPEVEPLVVENMRSDRTIVQEPHGWESIVRKPWNSSYTPTPYDPAVCTKTISMYINATNFGYVNQEDAYDITTTEIITIGMLGEMVGSSSAPVGVPVNPLTFTITPEAGGVEVYPALFYEYDIRTCVEPKEIIIRLFGETWPLQGPGTVGNPGVYYPPSAALADLQNCIVDSMDGVTRNSDFDRLKLDTDGHALIDPAAIVFRNPWEAVVLMNCTMQYNSPDPEIVLVDLPARCVKSGIKPIASEGPSPPRFQILIEQAASVALMDKVLMERDIREGSVPCITIILVGPDADRNDTFVEDSSRIYAEINSNKAGSGWEFGFNARKTTLLRPDNIQIIHQTSNNINDPAPAPGSEDRPKLLVCLNKDDQYEIHEEEVLTITIHGSAVSSGISPNYYNNEQLQVTIKPSGGNVTMLPDWFYEDEIREGSAVLTMLLEEGEEWAFNPSTCFIGPTPASCNPPVPTRAMCECANNVLCDAALRTSQSQPYGFSQRFDNIIQPTGFTFNSKDPQMLELRFTADELFDITEDQQVRVEIPGCATRSGVPTLTQYITIIRTPGKLSLVSQFPEVGSQLPCNHPICDHPSPLTFTERDIRNGSVELILRVDGDLWRNRPLDFQSGILSDCPALPPVTGINRPNCPDGFNAKLHDIVPSGAIDKVLDTDDRILKITFTPVPNYNIDFTETVCFNVPSTMMASDLEPVPHAAKFQEVYGMSNFCFNVTAVQGVVDIQTVPAKLCESHVRLGLSSFTIVLEEEFWETIAPTVLFSHITSNQTCDATLMNSGEYATCVGRYDQERVFVGQKTKGLLPTDPLTGVDLTKVKFLDGPAPYHTQLLYPFPEQSLIIHKQRPWYNIREDERIMIDVVSEAILSGLPPIYRYLLDYNLWDPTSPTYNSANLTDREITSKRTLGFDVHSTKIFSPMEIVFNESDIRNSSTLVFNLTLDCDEFVPGSEVLLAKGFTADVQPAPFPLTGWAGRRDSILRLDILKDDLGLDTILQVSILPDPEFDICTETEEIAIDFAIHTTHYTENEVTQMFASAEAPTPYHGEAITYYKTDINPNLHNGAWNEAWNMGDFFKIVVKNTPSNAALSVWKNGIDDLCPFPCEFTEDDIRKGMGGVNVSLDNNGNGFSDTSMLALGFNGSLNGMVDSFLDRICTIAPRTSVLPQPPLTRAEIDLRYAIIPFQVDPLFDIVEDEVVTFTIPDGGELYDRCQQRVWPSGASACFINPVGPFSFTIKGRAGKAESCNMSAYLSVEQLAGGPLTIGIEGFELDTSANSDVAFLLPRFTYDVAGQVTPAADVRCNTAWTSFKATGFNNPTAVLPDDMIDFVYGWTSDLGIGDLKGQSLVQMGTYIDQSGSFELCFRNKLTTDFYAVPACDTLVVGNPSWVEDKDNTATFGPFRVGESYTMNYRGSGLRENYILPTGETGGDEVKIVSEETTCDGVGRTTRELKSYTVNNIRTLDAISNDTLTYWPDAVFFESGSFRMCYRAYRSRVWKELRTFRVIGIVDGFTPRWVNASQSTFLTIEGKGLMNFDKVFGAYVPIPSTLATRHDRGDNLQDVLFDANFDCSASYPGDTYEVLRFPDVMGFNDYEQVNQPGLGLVTVTQIMKDVAKVRLKFGTFYRPGYYHLCYGFNNESRWDVVPGGTLRVLTSVSDYSPKEVEVYDILDPKISGFASNIYRDLFTFTSWINGLTTSVKAVHTGETCAKPGSGVHFSVEPLIAGPNTTTEPSWLPYQKTYQVKGGFDVPGEYWWCYEVRELFDCPQDTTAISLCPPDTEYSTNRWFMLPEPFIVTPLFDSSSKEFIPAGVASPITLTSITAIGVVLGQTMTLKYKHSAGVSCMSEHEWDNAVSFPIQYRLQDNTGKTYDTRLKQALDFTPTVFLSGEYIMCIGPHHVGRTLDMTLKVYPYVTGHADVDMEFRAEKVNPTRHLPGSATPLPIVFEGFGMHFAGQFVGEYRPADVFAAIPWGVPDGPNGNYTCGNYSAFDPSPFSTRESTWWYPFNKDVVRFEPDNALRLDTGTVNRATGLLWNATFTPGEHVLCFYDWVRAMWVNVYENQPEPNKSFYVPPNTPPQLDIIAQDITLHPNRGVVSISSFLFSSKAGLYLAEDDQNVIYTITQDLGFNDVQPFVFPRVPTYERATNILWFEIVPGATAGKYQFAIVALDDGGVLFSGNDTGSSVFNINIKGVTHAVVVPPKIDVNENVQVSLYGEGLTATGPNGEFGDCVRIVDANDPNGCFRQTVVPEKYYPSCLPDCYTPDDRLRFERLRTAWELGRAEGPYVLPEVIPAALQPSPLLPDPDVQYLQMVEAWRDGKYSASVYDVCDLKSTPHDLTEAPQGGGNNPFVTGAPAFVPRPTLAVINGGGDWLTATYFTTPTLPFPGEYALCYKLKGDTDSDWLPVRNSSFTVTAVVNTFAPHAIYAGHSANISFEGAGFSNVDEVVGVWVADSTNDALNIWPENVTCMDLAANTNNFFQNTFSSSNYFKGFTYPTNPTDRTTQDLKATTLTLDGSVIRRPGHYQVCYRVGYTNEWVTARGGLMRVFASLTEHDRLEQVTVGSTVSVNFKGIAVTATPQGSTRTNTTVTYKIVRSICTDDTFPDCQVNCVDSIYETQGARVMENIITIDDSTLTGNNFNDGLSRQGIETLTFNFPGYYYFCWYTKAAIDCFPKTDPATTCLSEDINSPFMLMPDPVIVSPVYTGFSPFVIEAGVETLVTVTGLSMYPYNLGPPGLALRNTFTNQTSCRQMGLPYKKQTSTLPMEHTIYNISDSRNVAARTLHLTASDSMLTFKINMTRAGDYDVCIGMTRVGGVNRPGLLPSCPLWTEAGASLSQGTCNNISTILENTVIRTQPRVTGVEELPMDQRPYGVPMNVTLRGFGMKELDQVFVINGTDGSLCHEWDANPTLSTFGSIAINEPFLQSPYASTFAGKGGALSYDALNITDYAILNTNPLFPPTSYDAQPFGIARANLPFVFPRPGEYKMCYRSSLYGWSREIQPNFVVPKPSISDWDWTVVDGLTPNVNFTFYGSGLNSVANSGDGLMLVRNDQINSNDDPCARPPSDFAVADRTDNLGMGDDLGANMTQYLWQDIDLNSFTVVRNYTICYAFCWLSEFPVTRVCEPYMSLGEIQTPIRNFPPVLDLVDDSFYSRSCSNVTIFRTKPSPGRAQEMWDTRSGTHMQNLTFTVTYKKQPDTTNLDNPVVACGSCAFQEPYIDDDGVLIHTFTALGKYEVQVTAVDTGGTAMGGIDTTTTKMFIIEVTGQNTPPILEVPERLAVVMSPTGVVVSPPVIVGGSQNVSGGIFAWESDTQTVFFDVATTTGILAPHFSAQPTYDSTTNTFTLPLTSYNKSGPVEIPILFTAFDDLVRGPRGDTPPLICGESRTVKPITIVVYPVNQPPLFNWQGLTTILVYPGLSYKLNLATPSVGPDYETVNQTIIESGATVVLDSNEDEFQNMVCICHSF